MNDAAELSNHVDEIMVELGVLEQFDESVNTLIKMADKGHDEEYIADVRFFMQKQYVMGYLNSMHYLMYDIKGIVHSKAKISKGEKDSYNKILSKITELINRI